MCIQFCHRFWYGFAKALEGHSLYKWSHPCGAIHPLTGQNWIVTESLSVDVWQLKPLCLLVSYPWNDVLLDFAIIGDICLRPPLGWFGKNSTNSKLSSQGKPWDVPGLPHVFYVYPQGNKPQAIRARFLPSRRAPAAVSEVSGTSPGLVGFMGGTVTSNT